MRRPLWLSLLWLALAAPTAGDIGSCGQEVAELDPQKFFTEKAATDCQSCFRCGFESAACERACAGEVPDDFETGCYPLVHDGEVCLNALRAAGCDEYAGYVADENATAPTECNFCPLGQRPEPAESQP